MKHQNINQSINPSIYKAVWNGCRLLVPIRQCVCGLQNCLSLPVF